MKPISPAVLALAVTTAMLLTPPPGSADEPHLLEWNARQLAEARLQITQHKSSAVRAWQQLQAEADKALKLSPPTVMNKPSAPPSGDKHDYQSYGPYWWPDPNKEDGLPYVRLLWPAAWIER